MNRARRTIVGVAAVMAAVIMVTNEVHAYGGPGSVVTGIGALLAAGAALLAALFGFIWFPLKKFIGKIRSNRRDETTGAEGS